MLISKVYINANILGQRQKGVIARSILFRPGGPLACELARHAVVLKVNDWVFCHGGLLPHHGKYVLAFKEVFYLTSSLYLLSCYGSLFHICATFLQFELPNNFS